MTRLKGRKDLEEKLKNIIIDGPPDTPDRIQLTGTITAVFNEEMKDWEFWTTMY